MTTATLTSPRHQELINIMTRAGKPLTSKQLFAEAKGFESQDDVSKTLNYLLKKGAVERELYAQNTYSYWPSSSQTRLDSASEKATIEAITDTAIKNNQRNDSGNTLLRIGEDDPMPTTPTSHVRAVINDALKPCPEIDAVTQEMANQAEIAYQVLSEALPLTQDQLSDLTLAELAEIAAARLQLHQASSIGHANFKATMCNTLDLNSSASSMDILAEIENLSRLADRTAPPAQNDRPGPYIIISDPRGCAGIYETIDEARKLAEGIARRSTSGRSAIVSVVAEVELVPQWSDA